MRTPLLITATLLATAMGSAQAQQGVSLASGFTDFTGWTMAGSATAQNQTPGNGFTYSQLFLTQLGVGGQAGSGFAPAPLTIDFNRAFHFDFNFYIPVYANPLDNGLRGDGMTLTLATAPGLGGGGSGLGYENMSSASVALAIDTFHFDGQPVSPSLQILQSGSVTPLAYTETGLGDAIRFTENQWYARLDYQPSGNADNMGTLTGRIEHNIQGTFEVQALVDFGALGLVGAPVYYGFTASNGLATDGHAVTSAVPVPEPQTWALMLSGLGLLGWLAGRRRVAPQG